MYGMDSADSLSIQVVRVAPGATTSVTGAGDLVQRL